VSPILLHELLSEIDYPDLEVCKHLESGFPLIGKIPVNHTASPGLVQKSDSSFDISSPPSWLTSILASRAQKIHDPILHAEVISQTISEISSGRMTEFAPLIPDSLVTRRFPVVHRSSKRKMKVRIIDDFKESRINSLCEISGRIRMGSISNLVEIAHRMWRSHPDRHIHISKADFSKAYRACPIKEDHLPFCRCVISHEGHLVTSGQLAMPFGAVSAVYAWDRLGEAITAILRESMLLPVDRYVDDLFWIDWAETSSDTLSQVLELVSIIGLTLDPDKSDVPSPKMDILGASVQLIQSTHRLLVKTAIDQAKASFWIQELSDLLSSKVISSGHFERMAGKLAFACFAAFGRSARSRLNSI
jgi:hypothetical protein